MAAVDYRVSSRSLFSTGGGGGGVATADGGVHADQSLREMRHDKKRRAGQAGIPGKAVGNRIPTLLMQARPLPLWHLIGGERRC